jgi:hypothetical protein
MNGLKEVLQDYSTFLYTYDEVLYDVTMFSDSDWHLDYENALAYTEIIRSKLEPYGI